MNRAAILDRLSASRSMLARHFGLREIGLFGSAAREELRPDSDIDILVEFDAPPDLERYFGLKDWLEQDLGRDVDLVTASGLKPRLRPRIERDLIRVA